MSIARTYAVALNGVDGDIVEVEADIAAGLPAFSLIGLPDTALGESRKRVVSAAMNAGCPLTTRKLTVNLSPASLRKQGSAFDLAIAVAALAAAGDLSPESAATTVHLGELGLDGRLRPVPGILPAVIAARAAGFSRVVVPTANAEEAELVDGMEVVPVASLRHVAIHHGSSLDPVDVESVTLGPGPGAASATAASSATSAPGAAAPPEPDLADVAGNEDAVEALVVAAAGGHHLSMVGPPGAGKTMLASRLPGLLPDLTPEQALEVTCIRSLGDGRGVGAVGSGGALIRRPPFEAPHHTASAAAIVGGGTMRIVPGAIVRASNGVLFLDEAAEFPPSVLDALRQPLESGTITIHRANGIAKLHLCTWLLVRSTSGNRRPTTKVSTGRLSVAPLWLRSVVGACTPFTRITISPLQRRVARRRHGAECLQRRTPLNTWWASMLTGSFDRIETSSR